MKAFNRPMQQYMDLKEVYTVNKQRRGVYADMIEKLAQLIRKRAANHRQTVIVVTGRPGTGKSTKAILLAREINPEWQISEGYVYGADDLRDILMEGRAKRSINLFDEGSVSFNSLRSNARDDRDMVILLDILRSWEMTTIICIPSFFDLNKRIRDHLIDFWIQCPERPLVAGKEPRGYFEVYAPSSGQWTGKTYWNFIGAGKCGKLPAAIDEEYQQIKYDHQVRQVCDFLANRKTNKKKSQEAEE